PDSSHCNRIHQRERPGSLAGTGPFSYEARLVPGLRLECLLVLAAIVAAVAVDGVAIVAGFVAADIAVAAAADLDEAVQANGARTSDAADAVDRRAGRGRHAEQCDSLRPRRIVGAEIVLA